MQFVKTMILLLAIISSGCVRTSCDDHGGERDVMKISWTEFQVGDSGDETKFYLNGRYVGVGAGGFNLVLDFIETIPDGSTIMFIYDKPSNLGGGTLYSFPFEDLRLDSNLIAIAERKKLTLKLSEPRDMLGTIYLYRPTGSYFED